MKYVYLLKSARKKECFHLGVENDLNEALVHHNSYRNPITSQLVPWDLEVAFRFKDHRKAFDFKNYLQSKAGKAYLRKHFISREQVPAVWV